MNANVLTVNVKRTTKLMYIDEELMKFLEPFKGGSIDVNFMISIIKTVAREYETEQLKKK